MTTIKKHWRWILLVLIALGTRLYLLSIFDVELSQDGFEAVRTLTIWQTQGIAALPRELLDRALLHPLYMLLLALLRWITPAFVDFYFVARLLSTLLACVAIGLMFEFTRRVFGALRIAAWIAALFLAFAPTLLWESIAILSSTLFLAFYIAVLLVLAQARYRLAAFLALLASLVRYEGVVLIALTFIALFIRDIRARKFRWSDWLVCVAFAFAFPLSLVAGSWVATGDPLQFIGAQSMAGIWLRFLAPGDFLKRGAFFITRYPALMPEPMVWLGVIGALGALIRHRVRGAGLLVLVSTLYLIFFELLVWLNYTTLETRFLMYPGLALFVFAGVALAKAHQFAARFARPAANVALAVVIVGLCAMGFQQGNAGMRFVYNMHASQREVADELVQLVPPNQKTNVLVYGGIAGALDYYARQRGLDLEMIFFRFAPDENPEQYLIDHRIQFVIYPAGNAFAKAKFPYLEMYDSLTRGGVTFQPRALFFTTLDNQRYSIWSASY